jgi:hypothetical protein
MASFTPTVRSNSDWKRLYEAAVCETDPSKLMHRIVAARSAIFNEIEAGIATSSVGQQCAMDAALRTLRRLAKRLDS